MGATDMADLIKAREGIAKHFLEAQPNPWVNGVAIGIDPQRRGEGPPQILVFVNPAAGCELNEIERFAREQGAVPVRTSRFVGLAALGDPVSYYAPFRYNLPPVSVGTAGAIVRAGGDQYILSSNHVLAHNGRAQPTTPIVSPGPLEDPTWGQVVGELAYWVELQPPTWPFSGTPKNLADCALARLTGTIPASPTALSLLAGPLTIPTTVTRIQRGNPSNVDGLASMFLADVYIDFTFGTYAFSGMIGVAGRQPFAVPGDSGSMATASGGQGIGLVTARAYTFDASDNFNGYIVLLSPLTAVRDGLLAAIPTPQLDFFT
jgi:hypothetical protein